MAESPKGVVRERYVKCPWALTALHVAAENKDEALVTVDAGNFLGAETYPSSLSAWHRTRSVRGSRIHRGDGFRLGREAYGISNKTGEAEAARSRDFMTSKMALSVHYRSHCPVTAGPGQ